MISSASPRPGCAFAGGGLGDSTLLPKELADAAGKVILQYWRKPEPCLHKDLDTHVRTLEPAYWAPFPQHPFPAVMVLVVW